MKPILTHTAPGPMAGYLFQPDRALFLLAQSNSDTTIGIEVVDDLSIVDTDGKVIYREQSKHSILDKGQPFQNRSKDIWHTLSIWIQAAERKEIDPTKAKLVCATNKNLSDDLLVKKISSAKNKKEVSAILQLLKTVSTKPAEGIKKSVEFVFTHEKILEKIIPIIELSDGSSKDVLDKEIIRLLKLVPESANDTLVYLKGWVHSCTTEFFDKGQPALIKVSNFLTALNNANYAYHSKQIKIRLKNIVAETIPKGEKEESKSRLFVKQLEIISHPQIEDIIIEAIDDFLCSESERTRLVIDGEISKGDLSGMDERNKGRWLESFRRHITKINAGVSEKELQEIAFNIYDSTISGYYNHLRGTNVEPYLTKGSFYKMSDEPLIGWHPHWKKLFKEEK